MKSGIIIIVLLLASVYCDSIKFHEKIFNHDASSVE